MKFNNLSNQQKGSLLAFIGVMFITPDSLFIRLANIETWGMLFYRGAIPFIVVLFGLLLFYKNNFLKALLRIGYPGIFYIISFSFCNFKKSFFRSVLFKISVSEVNTSWETPNFFKSSLIILIDASTEFFLITL